MRVAVVAVLVAGCFPESTYECDRDVDCSGGELCARTHECLLASLVRGVRVTWTVQGQTDLAAACSDAGLAELTIRYSAPDGTQLTYAPVQCTLGMYLLDKLPTWFDRIELWGYGLGDVLFSGSVTIGPAPEYQIAL